MRRNVVKTLYIFLFLAVLFFSLTYFTFSVKAEDLTEKESSLYNPVSTIEYNQIKKPASIDSATFTVSSNGNQIFLTDGSNGFKMFDIDNDCYKYIETNLGSPSKVIKYDDKNVLILIDESLYCMDVTLETPTLNQLVYDGNGVTAKTFDIFDNVLVRISGEYLYKCTLSGQELISSAKLHIRTGNNHILALDGENVFFSQNGTGLDICSVNNGEVCSQFSETIPDCITSDGEYLYCVSGNVLFKINIETKENTILSFTSNYNLGSLGTVKSMCVTNGKLLTVSTFNNDLSAIQEFEIKENEVAFTGFAISNGNTAYNRIGKDATDIINSGNVVATCDSKKITVIKETNNERIFYNFLTEDLDFVPTKLSIHKNKLLCYDDTYYVILNLNELDKDLPEKQTFTTVEELGFENYWNENVKTVKDLAGNEFVLDNGKLKDGDTSFSLSFPEGLILENSDIKSFSFDFEKKEIYFLIKNEEVILTSTEFSNKTISEITLDGYKATGENAESLSNLSVYTIDSDVNVYRLSIDTANDNALTYNGLSDNYKGEFVKVYALQDEYSAFSILAGHNENNQDLIVLVKNDNLNQVNCAKTNVENYVYSSTSVDMYYLPVITESRFFPLSKEGSIIRLTRGTEIYVEKSIDVNGKTFYYGTVQYGGASVTGYVPKDFTVKILAKEYIRKTFRYEKVSSVTVYDELDAEIATLEKGTTVKVYQTKNGKCTISFSLGEEEKFGFIDESAIIKKQDNTVKYVICIGLLSVCAFITTAYFVFRKNNEDDFDNAKD